MLLSLINGCMSAEIVSHNLGDPQRYNLLPIIAKRMGLSLKSLWKDRALAELNTAVLHSFSEHGVSIIDHHSASSQFMPHTEQSGTAHISRSIGG